MSAERTVTDYLDANYDRFADHARAIWERPETALQERFASRLIADELEASGFSVVWGAGGMETAFVASWGEAGPIVGVLGEYDALPSLSQDATPARRELVSGGPGHGCGHNLYGVAALGAALAMQAAMCEHGVAGTVRFYGCPAEETLTGKTYMARTGAFDDLDAAITWHPSSVNGVWANRSSLAMNSFKVHFHGVAAHGAGDPHRGRSALDGAMLMDVGVNYLREHVEQDTRIHSVITDGGRAPNVVPPEATIWYFVRAPKREQVEAVYARVLDCARGAALMSGTTYDVEFLTGCYEFLPNDVISQTMLAKMDALGPVAFSDDEEAFARDLQASLSDEAIASARREALELAAAGTTADDIGDVLCRSVIRPSETFRIVHGSTEVGDVSQITPTGNLVTCCHPLGSPGHSWQITAASGAAIGVRGMDYAAKAMALTGLDLMTKPDLLAAARAEFDGATGGRAYVSPLPDGATPQ
jgi:aminobenzoyl-glutamate utilization protein B